MAPYRQARAATDRCPTGRVRPARQESRAAPGRGGAPPLAGHVTSCPPTSAGRRRCRQGSVGRMRVRAPRRRDAALPATAACRRRHRVACCRVRRPSATRAPRRCLASGSRPSPAARRPGRWRGGSPSRCGLGRRALGRRAEHRSHGRSSPAAQTFAPGPIHRAGRPRSQPGRRGTGRGRPASAILVKR